MAWEREGCSKQPFDVYTGPSWSWAGCNGSTHRYWLYPHWKDVAIIESWHTKLKNKSNLFGEVEAAWIQINGPMISLTHGLVLGNEWQPNHDT